MTTYKHDYYFFKVITQSHIIVRIRLEYLISYNCVQKLLRNFNTKMYNECNSLTSMHKIRQVNMPLKLFNHEENMDESLNRKTCAPDFQDKREYQAKI